MYDVIIIGGGYGGLAAGALLARRGFKVLLAEKSSELGGRAKIERKEGYLLDWGIHSHRGGEKGPLAHLFRQLGKTLQFAGPPHVQSYVHSAGRLIPLPLSPAGYLSSPHFSPKDKAQILRTFIRIVRSQPDNWYQKNLLEFINPKKISDQFNIFILFLSLIVMADNPSQVSAGEIISIVKSAIPAKRKVANLINGSEQIISTCANEIKKQGEIKTQTRISNLKIEKGKVSSAITQQKEFKAQAFLFAAPVNQLINLVADHYLPPELIRFCNSLVSTAGLTIDFGLREKVSNIAGSIFKFKPIIIGNFPSNIDPGRAPQGKQLSTWLCTMSPPINQEKISQTENYLRSIIQQIFPEFFTKVEWERKLVHPIMDGVLLTPNQSLPNRPPVKLPTLSNLFLAGDTVQAPGTGGDIAFCSALKVASEIEKYLRSSS